MDGGRSGGAGTDEAAFLEAHLLYRGRERASVLQISVILKRPPAAALQQSTPTFFCLDPFSALSYLRLLSSVNTANKFFYYYSVSPGVIKQELTETLCI